MPMLPGDVNARIHSDFSEVDQQREVVDLLSALWARPLNVGPAQLCRSILVLAEGNVTVVRKLCDELMGDPRDVIMAAERKADDPGHYGIPPFTFERYAYGHATSQ